MRASRTVALSAAALLLAGCSSHPKASAPTPSSAAPTSPAPTAVGLAGPPDGIGLDRQPFPDSLWTKPLPADVPLDPRSAALAADLAKQVADNKADKGYNATVNTTQYTPPVYRVGADTPAVTVVPDNCQNKTAARMQQWQDALGPVPIPVTAMSSAGSDSQVVVWQQSSDTVWELWKAKKAADGTWSACWGGKLPHASTSQGVFPFPYGTAASGISEIAGLMTPEEVASGHIDHALSVALPVTGKAQVPPATRNDGQGPPATTLSEGARFRLPPDYPVDGGPARQAILTALKTYGAVVTDTSGSFSVFGENRLASTGVDAWLPVFGGTKSAIFKGVDWSRIQVVDPAFSAVS